MKKIIPIILFISLASGTLFYLSDISFQLEYFNWKLWAIEMVYYLVLSAIGCFMVYRHGKRWEKKREE